MALLIAIGFRPTTSHATFLMQADGGRVVAAKVGKTKETADPCYVSVVEDEVSILHGYGQSKHVKVMHMNEAIKYLSSVGVPIDFDQLLKENTCNRN